MMTNKKMTRLLAAVLMLCLLLAGCKQETALPGETDAAGKPVDTDVPGTPAVTETVPPETKPEMSVSDLLKATLTLKGDLEDALDLIEEDDLPAAREKMTSVMEKTAIVRTSLEATLESMGSSMPSLTKELENMKSLLDLVDLASAKILIPGLDFMEAHPFENMSSQKGVNMKLIWDYVDFMETLMPDVTELVAVAETVDLSIVDSDGDLEEHLTDARELLDMYSQDGAMFQNLKDMLGANGDRLYVVAPQNSTEIRASGGFPGAIGTLRIQNGILTIGEFDKVYDVLAWKTPAEAEVTSQENQLFHSGMLAPRDADYCPDFERVGYIFALGYESRQKENVDGVISMTPVLVQRLLEATEEEIKLFDGNVLTGDNAVKVLGYDLYYQYLGRGADVQGKNEFTDQLFVDAAKKTFQVLMDNMSASDLLKYMDVAEESFEDRTLMLWMKDEAEQNLVRQMGWNAGLNKDPEKPQAGIYYSCNLASKMGWFLIMDVEVGDRVKNEDGSYTYPITVTLSNDMTDEELKKAGSYITGNSGGVVMGTAYFFAPAGGTIGDFVVSRGKIVEDVYQDLQLGYLKGANVDRKTPITISYNVTTAPGVETELTLSMTPTVQDYH